MARSFARTIASTVAALALLVALGANAQTAKWDQAAVTAAAADFEKSVSGLRNAVRQNQQATLAPNRAGTYLILQDLRQMEWLAQTLHADLVKGESMESTTPTLYEILEERDYALVDAMFVDISDFVKPKIAASRAALEKLQTFYPPAPKGT